MVWLRPLTMRTVAPQHVDTVAGAQRPQAWHAQGTGVELLHLFPHRHCLLLLLPLLLDLSKTIRCLLDALLVRVRVGVRVRARARVGVRVRRRVRRRRIVKERSRRRKGQ